MNLETVIETEPGDDREWDDIQAFDQIVCNPAILGGKPTIRGHRISVSFVLERLASGESIDSFAEAYGLDRTSVVQAMMYAASQLSKCGKAEAPGLV